MKVNRHAKIIELINKYHIETHEPGGIQSYSGNGIQRYP